MLTAMIEVLLRFPDNAPDVLQKVGNKLGAARPPLADVTTAQYVLRLYVCLFLRHLLLAADVDEGFLDALGDLNMELFPGDLIEKPH